MSELSHAHLENVKEQLLDKIKNANENDLRDIALDVLPESGEDIQKLYRYETLTIPEIDPLKTKIDCYYIVYGNETNDIKIVYVTGHSSDDYLPRCYFIGNEELWPMDDYKFICEVDLLEIAEYYINKAKDK